MFGGAVPGYGYEKMVTRGGRYEFFALAQTPVRSFIFTAVLLSNPLFPLALGRMCGWLHL